MKSELAVVFSHGQESGPWGTKINAMAEMVRARGLRAESIDYRGITNPDARVEKLEQESALIKERQLLVGSSMGGYVAARAAEQLGAVGLFVLAPAFFIAELPRFRPPQVASEIVHGWHDDVVPVENSIRYARETAATLHIVDGDHRLGSNIGEINVYLARFLDQLSAA